jgi:hypothetical protein
VQQGIVDLVEDIRQNRFVECNTEIISRPFMDLSTALAPGPGQGGQSPVFAWGSGTNAVADAGSWRSADVDGLDAGVWDLGEPTGLDPLEQPHGPCSH